MSEVKVPAADQTLRILQLLTTSRGPLPASMIATQLELPRSTVYHLLAALQEHGFVMHLPEERRYGLGIAALELGSAYARQEPLARLGRPLVAALVHRVHANGHLAVPHGRDVLYVVEERIPGGAALVSDVDVRLPMHLTASGRAILAALPKAQVRALFPDRAAFVHRHDVAGEQHIDRYSKLRSVLDDTVTRGYAVERGAVTEGISSVAVPVLDHRSWPVAAIALTFRDGEVAVDAFDGLAAELRAAAELLSVRIHGRPA
ncbi:IclR family transcriptional regulator [Leucobacter luti]|uniref:Glycerol operon regulatory protein n=1 Tax=Leucobacter luti TaxID=340320 RepID=A0A4Q7TZG7_9MICO|nr:IclR family transcriptional regulator [Leucobacter luti]MBL3698516.1 IclR family transcriptional regulator [Leucobacter luti]RZT65890.1 IclR family transcriptional regulator [Leucobacter luti]